MSNIKLHGGQFNVCTRDIRYGIHELAGMNVLSVLFCSCGVQNNNDLYVNGLYDLLYNGLNVLTIKVCPHDVCGMH